MKDSIAANYSLVVEPFQEKHLKIMLLMEHHNFATPWSESDFLAFYGEIGNLIQVATVRGTPVGYICFTVQFEIMNLTVAHKMQRLGIGAYLITKLKMAPKNICSQITATVSENNLPAQQFFRSQGFKCHKVVKDPYGIKHHDGYQMVWQRGLESGN